MDELPCLGAAKVDKLRGDSGTEMTIKKIDFDIPIPDEMFSERELLKKKKKI